MGNIHTHVKLISLSEWKEEDELCCINEKYYTHFDPDGEGKWNTQVVYFKIDEHEVAHYLPSAEGAYGHVVLVGGKIIWGNELARRLLHDTEGNNAMRKCTLITTAFRKKLIDIINEQGPYIFSEEEYTKFNRIIKNQEEDKHDSVKNHQEHLRLLSEIKQKM